MKRSALHSSQKPMKRSRLKPVSNRTAKLKRQTNPARRAYVAEIGFCLCGQPAVDPHEIAAGSSREKALHNRFAWLALCRKCHERIQGSPIAEQLVYKALQDSEEFYDREGLNFLMGKAANAVSEVDVIRAAYQLGQQSREGKR